MPRNKSEKPTALAPISHVPHISATTMEGMNDLLRKSNRDIAALLELLEEARSEAGEWRAIAFDVESGRTPRIGLPDEERLLPWEENGA